MLHVMYVTEAKMIRYGHLMDGWPLFTCLEISPVTFCADSWCTADSVQRNLHIYFAPGRPSLKKLEDEVVRAGDRDWEYLLSEAKLSVISCGHLMDGWLLCACIEISPESDPVQKIIQQHNLLELSSLWWDYKPRSPRVYTHAKRPHMPVKGPV